MFSYYLSYFRRKLLCRRKFCNIRKSLREVEHILNKC